MSNEENSKGTLRALSFEIVDKDGKPRGCLAVRPEGTPVLGLFDENGTARCTLQIEPDKSVGIGLFDTSGRNRGGIGLAPDQRPVISVVGNGGQSVGLSLGPAAEPILMLDTNDRKQYTQLGLSPDGSPDISFFRVALFSGVATTATALEVLEDGDVGLVIRDDDGIIRAVFSVARDGRPVIAMLDAKGRTTWKVP